MLIVRMEKHHMFSCEALCLQVDFTLLLLFIPRCKAALDKENRHAGSENGLDKRFHPTLTNKDTSDLVCLSSAHIL